MRILLYGATGLLGQRILADAVERGHEVTAASSDPARIQELPGVTLVQGDVLDVDSVATLAEGHDAIVSAVGPGHAGDPCFPCQVASAVLEAARRTGVRVLAVGETGGPEAMPGVQPAVTLDFAATWTGAAQAQADALELYRAAPGCRELDLSGPGRGHRARRTGRGSPVGRDRRGSRPRRA
jgi:putative NADH-flavin reductase